MTACDIYKVTTFQTTSNSLTLPMWIGTLLSMYVSMILPAIQLVVSYRSRKTTTCASIGYRARLFAKKNLNELSSS